MTPVFSHMILQTSFYADLELKKHLLLLSFMSKSVVLLNIFVETDIFLRIVWWIESSKEHLSYKYFVTLKMSFLSVFLGGGGVASIMSWTVTEITVIYLIFIHKL